MYDTINLIIITNLLRCKITLYGKGEKIRWCILKQEMGFFKKFFMGKEISAEENARRMGGVNKNKNNFATKPIMDMTENEKLNYWSKVREIDDLEERIRLLTPLAEADFASGYYDLTYAYMELGKITGKYHWDELMKWAKKSADEDMLMAHYTYSNLLSNSKNPLGDIDESIKELVRGVENGESLSIERISKIINSMEDEETKVDVIERFQEELEPVVKRCEAENDDKSNYLLGLLYFYGLYYAQDMDKAGQHLQAAKKMGYIEAEIFLDDNPLFDEDDDYDEDEDD